MLLATDRGGNQVRTFSTWRPRIGSSIISHQLYRTFSMVASIGGDLVQVSGGRGRRVNAENFFYRPPKNTKFGGKAGDSLSLGTKYWLSIVM